MKKLLVFTVVFSLLVSCIRVYEFMTARFVKPDEARRYKSKGALVLGTIDKENAPFLAIVFFMLKKSPDITVAVNQDFTMFVFDVSEITEGFNRIGMRYQAFGIDFWMNKELDFKVEKNKLNYIGRFIFYAKDDIKTHRMVMIWTNLIEEDIKNLNEFYPDLTNMEVSPVEIKDGMYYFYQ